MQTKVEIKETRTHADQTMSMCAKVTCAPLAAPQNSSQESKPLSCLGK